MINKNKDTPAGVVDLGTPVGPGDGGAPLLGCGGAVDPWNSDKPMSECCNQFKEYLAELLLQAVESRLE